MENIIPKIPTSLILKELNKEKQLRKTNKSNNEIYIVDNHNAPNTTKEIGRLRELAFRAAGGGTGKAFDLDKYDISENPYQQLIIWDPDENIIMGGYRFKICNNINFDTNEKPNFSTSHLFDFSENFIKNYLPYTIELGRSFVSTTDQIAIDNRKRIFILDNLWDGLASLWQQNPFIKYYFGKVTIYSNYNIQAKLLLYTFFHKYFQDDQNLVTPMKNLEIVTDIKDTLQCFTGKNYDEDTKILSQEMKNLGENIPPIINSYMRISSTMKSFGTSKNRAFGEVEETGIMITINDIFPEKMNRHLSV